MNVGDPFLKRSGKVGGAAPSRTHAVRWIGHKPSLTAVARVPSGQQTTSSVTLAGRGFGAAFIASGNAVKMSVSKGAATLAPKNPGFGVPSGRPTHTPIVYRSLTPTAHASRKPKLVPVFHAKPRYGPLPSTTRPTGPPVSRMSRTMNAAPSLIIRRSWSGASGTNRGTPDNPLRTSAE